MQVKTFPAPRLGLKVGEDDGLELGQYEQFVSVFGNVDFHGDRVLPGAFRKTLRKWKESGDPIPIVFSHQHEDPFAHIGYALDAKEREHGLWVRGQLDLDNPKAAQIYRLLKGRRITNASFAYDVKDAEESEDPLDEGKGFLGFPVLNLKELEVFEVGPCLVGANRATDLVAVKVAYQETATLHQRFCMAPATKGEEEEELPKPQVKALERLASLVGVEA